MSRPTMPEVAVNGQVIPAAAIAQETQHHKAPRAKPGWAWRAAAKALSIRALLLQEAAARGLAPEQMEISPGKRETMEEALIRALLDAEINPEPPTPEAIRAAYDSNPARFRAPSLFEAAHILFPAAPGDTEAREKARTKAEAALKSVLSTPKQFGELARAESACPSGKSGGHLGQLATGDTVPEFETAMEALSLGQIAPAPVETRYGFHVLRLDAHVEGDILPFDAAAERIRGTLEKAAWVQAANAFVTRLATKAEITGIDLGPIGEKAN